MIYLGIIVTMSQHSYNNPEINLIVR